MRCPVCNTDVKIRWKGTDLKQCSCNVILTLTGAGNWAIAHNKLIQEQPATFVMIGTEGVSEKKKFTVTGRICAQEKESLINYWSVAFEDESRAILAEGYGHYSILQKTTADFDINFLKFEKMKAGDAPVSSLRKFRLTRKSIYSKVNVEGENQWPGFTGFSTYDFFSNDGTCTQIVQFDKGLAFHFNCKFYLPSELKLTNTKTTSASKELLCKNCNTVNAIHAFPYSYCVSCKSCGLRFAYDRMTETYRPTHKNDKGFASDIEIGSNATWDGVEFKVVGYARKEESNMDAAQWNEYTLYNPTLGFAYLSEFEGHWVYVKEWPRPPLVTSQGRDYFIENDNEFEIFNDYRYNVIGAIGEHIYDLNETGDFSVKEFIHPPQILTVEKSMTEENWFYGEHADRKKVEQCFSMPGGLPVKTGIGAVQPFAFINKSTLLKISAMGVAFIILVHLLMSMTHHEKTLFSETVSFPQDAGSINALTPMFTLSKKESNLQVNFSAPVSNSWLELEGSFVNTETGKEFGFNKGIEYYYGYTDGENWTEGKREETVLLTEIPAGTYYLEYKATRDSSYNMQNAVQSVNLQVKYDVTLSRNMLWTIGFVLLVALIQFGIYYYYDKKRWSNSKYTPYNYE